MFLGLEGESEESDQDEGRDKRLIVQSHCTGCIVVGSVTTQWWALDGSSWGMKNGFSECFTVVQGCWLGMYGCMGVYNELFIVLAGCIFQGCGFGIYKCTGMYNRGFIISALWCKLDYLKLLY